MSTLLCVILTMSHDPMGLSVIKVSLFDRNMSQFCILNKIKKTHSVQNKAF